jgi:hypothetical protein
LSAPQLVVQAGEPLSARTTYIENATPQIGGRTNFSCTCQGSDLQYRFLPFLERCAVKAKSASISLDPPCRIAAQLTV